MSQNTPRLDLPLIQPAQAQKHVTHNSAIEVLDAITQLNVLERDALTPPTSAGEGDSYALGLSPSGDWTGEGGKLAVRTNGGWMFIPPRDGWRLWDAQTSEICVYTSGSWSPTAPDLQNISGVGINTTSDANNGLAVSSPAVLLSHGSGSGGHQLKVNKAAATDTASLLFQTGWSGRAEMGTTGTDDFTIKVSADGSTFTNAMSFDATTGLVSGEAVQQSASDTSAGRLMRADYGYGPGNLVGTVSELSGLPTGAALEGMRTTMGDYVRLADGTQICSFNITLNFGAANRLESVWTFPVPFQASPESVSGTINANSLLANAAPKLDEICGVVHANTTPTEAKLLLFRVVGATDFAPGDSVNCRVTAIGRWF